MTNLRKFIQGKTNKKNGVMYTEKQKKKPYINVIKSDKIQKQTNS